MVGIVERLWGWWLNRGDAVIDLCRVAGGNGGYRSAEMVVYAWYDGCGCDGT